MSCAFRFKHVENFPDVRSFLRIKRDTTDSESPQLAVRCRCFCGSMKKSIDFIFVFGILDNFRDSFDKIRRHQLECDDSKTKDVERCSVMSSRCATLFFVICELRRRKELRRATDT